jgi:hypothetical protein
METTCQVWLALKSQYLGIHESHILQLDAKFCVFKQDDLSINNYYHKMKGRVDDLRALGKTVTNHHLVLNRI